mmetsp:Transcript_44051/g.80499  ORF Transcript_44051/g.80499 Transcript_44051/m.80499 type:complete len:150 (+) Transcript_44051:75-524(+)
MWCRSCCSNDDMLAATTATKTTGLEEEVVDDCAKVAVPPAVARAEEGSAKSFPSEGQPYRVKVTKVDGRLGVVIGYLDEEDAQARVTQILDGSAMDAWNLQNPDRPVLPNYVVLEVNGATSAAEICKEIRVSTEIDMLVQMSNTPAPEL